MKEQRQQLHEQIKKLVLDAYRDEALAPPGWIESLDVHGPAYIPTGGWRARVPPRLLAPRKLI